MPKITMIGAGSTVFSKEVLGDSIVTPSLAQSEIALFDIDPVRLEESKAILSNINRIHGGKAKISTYTDRERALAGADFVINAIQIGGYKPCTVTDFEVPKKYGLRQTIGDTNGIGGIFRALRTIPVMLDIAKDMERLCPDAWLLNYTNPMSMIMGAWFRSTGVKAVGLCHSVQICAEKLLESLGMEYDKRVQWSIAGVNHQSWLLEISKDKKDLYPEIRLRAEKQGAPDNDRVRFEVMKRFGYYVTESSEHCAEYMPYFIKSSYPELIEKFNVPLDEYPRRCIRNIERWAGLKEKLIKESDTPHKRSHEYASYIMEAMVTNVPYKLHGNLPNDGLITNLPREACVEVPTLVDASGINPCYVGDLPPQCAALNRTMINPQLLTIEAALTLKKEHIYHAALLDPHLASELPIDQIIALCDDLIAAHEGWLPKYQ